MTTKESTTALRQRCTGPSTNMPPSTRPLAIETDVPTLTPASIVSKSGARTWSESMSTSTPIVAPSARRYQFKSGVPVSRWIGGRAHKRSASHQRK